MFSQFSPAFISTMRSTLDIDPHLYCAHWASGRNWQPQAISSWPARLEGQDIFIDFRWAEGNYARLAEFAAELIRLRVDVLVTYGTPENPRGQTGHRNPAHHNARQRRRRRHGYRSEPRAPRVAATAIIEGQTRGRKLSGHKRASDPAIAPRWSACPDGNASQALPERGIPWRRPWTTTRSGRLRSTKRLNRCGSTPARATQQSMWSAPRAIWFSRLLNLA
jgi:hypothetical protein